VTLSTVRKIGPVLDLFTPDRPEWRMSDIARALDMPKSSAHSLVASLAEVGLLSVGSPGRYRLSWNVLSLYERMRGGHDFTRIAGPAMERLVSVARETVLIGVLDRREILYVERVESSHPVVRLAGLRVGSRAALHATAVGKAILAHREPGERRVMLGDDPLRQYTAATITSADRLTAALDAAREEGVAQSHRELHAEIACLAAPIRDAYGFVTSALSISMPAYRFEASRERLVEPLRRAAATISAQLAEHQLSDRETEDAGDPVLGGVL
jgi:DNA-binding IclR family transcriptional regulator